MAFDYFVYIMANKKNGTIYIGVTNSLLRRVYEHKNNLVKGFSIKDELYNLVYYEYLSDAHSAKEREKKIKKLNREWKVRLIEKENPGWKDLYFELI